MTQTNTQDNHSQSDNTKTNKGREIHNISTALKTYNIGYAKLNQYIQDGTLKSWTKGKGRLFYADDLVKVHPSLGERQIRTQTTPKTSYEKNQQSKESDLQKELAYLKVELKEKNSQIDKLLSLIEQKETQLSTVITNLTKQDQIIKEVAMVLNVLQQND